jgi:hypothetical protein
MVTQSIRRGGHPVIGFGQIGELATPQSDHDRVAPLPTSTPWVEVIASSVVGVATGWLIEEIVAGIRGVRRMR